MQLQQPSHTEFLRFWVSVQLFGLTEQMRLRSGLISLSSYLNANKNRFASAVATWQMARGLHFKSAVFISMLAHALSAFTWLYRGSVWNWFCSIASTGVPGRVPGIAHRYYWVTQVPQADHYPRVRLLSLHSIYRSSHLGWATEILHCWHKRLLVFCFQPLSYYFCVLSYLRVLHRPLCEEAYSVCFVCLYYPTGSRRPASVSAPLLADAKGEVRKQCRMLCQAPCQQTEEPSTPDSWLCSPPSQHGSLLVYF